MFCQFRWLVSCIARNFIIYILCSYLSKFINNCLFSSGMYVSFSISKSFCISSTAVVKAGFKSADLLAVLSAILFPIKPSLGSIVFMLLFLMQFEIFCSRLLHWIKKFLTIFTCNILNSTFSKRSNPKSITYLLFLGSIESLVYLFLFIYLHHQLVIAVKFIVSFISIFQNSE